MKLGAEPKKIAILGVLLVVAAVVAWMNIFQDDSGGAAPRPAVPVAALAPSRAPVSTESAPPEGGPRRREQTNNSVSEFKPRQGYARPEDKPDPATVDPTLKLELLAKVQKVEIESAGRNLFQYGAAPPKPVELPKNPPTIPINNKPPEQPKPLPTVDPGLAAKPQAPPMTFKYYGFKVSTSSGRKEAFLLDGDDIIIAGENDVVKRGRYKVVRIGVNSIVIEDSEFKSTQTLQLQEDGVV